jgi:hypothetical protein
MIVPTITIEARMLSIEMYAAEEPVLAPLSEVSIAAAGSVYDAIAATGPSAHPAAKIPAVRTTGRFTNRTAARTSDPRNERILIP